MPSSRRNKVSVDIDAQRATQEATDGAESGLYLALFELLDEGVIIASDEMILEANSAACRLLQRDYRQLAGHSLSILFPTERAFLNARARLFIQGEMQGHLQIALPSGEIRNLRFSAAARIRPGIHALVLSPDLYTQEPTNTKSTGSLTADMLWPRLAAAIDQPLVVLDAQDRVMAANAAFLRSLGMTRDELVGFEITQKLAVSFPQAHERPRVKIETPAGQHLEGRLLNGPQPGWRLLILALGLPLPPALEVEEGRFHKALAKTPLPCLLIDPVTGRILNANEPALHFYGDPQKGMEGESLSTFREEDAPSFPTYLPQSGLWRLLHPEKGLFEAEVWVFTLGFRSGARFLLLVHDRPETSVWAAPFPRTLAALFDSFGQAFMVCNAENQILLSNQHLTELTGYRREELQGQTPSLLNSGHHDSAFFAVLWNQLLATGRWQGHVWNRMKNGEIRPCWLAIEAVRNRHGAPLHYLGYLSEWGQEPLTETGTQWVKPVPPPENPAVQYPTLPTMDVLETAFQRAQSGVKALGQQMAFTVLELANAPQWLSRLGKAGVDLLLRQATRRLRHTLGPELQVAALGETGLLVLKREQGGHEAEMTAQEMRDILNAPFTLEQHEHNPGFHVGMSLFPSQGNAFSGLVAHAKEAACAHNMEATGGLRWQKHDALTVLLQGDESPEQRPFRARAAQLHGAARRGELRLRFLPYFDPVMNQINAAKAQVYWQHPEDGLLSPEVYRAFRPDPASLLALDEWGLEAACTAAADWPAEARLFLSLHAMQWGQSDLSERIADVLARAGVFPAQVYLTVPGRSLENDTVIDNLFALHAQGLGIFLDDFGEAPVSLVHLRQLPFSGARLSERLCAAGIEAQALRDVACALAKPLGLPLLAEHVQSERQSTLLAREGCVLQAGPLFGEPVDMPHLLKQFGY
jgi:PAS domain S-box-containing protein